MPKRRRQPKFGAFMVTGGIVGFLVGGLVGARGPDSDKYSVGPEVLYVGIFFAGVGLLLAGVVAVLLDRRR